MNMQPGMASPQSLMDGLTLIATSWMMHTGEKRTASA